MVHLVQIPQRRGPYRHTTMEKLPMETLLQILQDACTDGGYTGCSLSQTSRAMRAASQPVRFHSIALSTDVNRLESFLTSYQNLSSLEDGSRAKIYHLLLEGDEEDTNITVLEVDLRPPCNPQAVRLLHLVADDLVSLVLPSTLMRPPTTGDLLLPYGPFPSLKTLIVNIPRDPRPTILVVPATATVPPLFPALTHVHIVMPPRRSSFRLAPFSAWNAHAPRATHLRISFCPLMGRAQKDLPLLLGTPTYRSGRIGRPAPVRPPPDTRTWPSLRHVAIQPVTDPDILGLPTGNPGLLYWGLRSELSCMVEWAKKEQIFASARVLEPNPSRFCVMPTRISCASREWRVAIREQWEMVMTHGVDSEWLTLGQEDEPPEEDDPSEQGEPPEE